MRSLKFSEQRQTFDVRLVHERAEILELCTRYALGEKTFVRFLPLMTTHVFRFFPHADAERGQAPLEVQALGERSDGEVGEIWHGFGTELSGAAATR